LTDPTATDQLLDSSAVEELLRILLKGLRATQLYLPNNPVYKAALANLHKAFGPVWDEVPDLVLDIQETELLWEGEVVLSQERNESLAWLLYKDGIRSLTMERGVEEKEITNLLRVLNKAKNLPPDADDDLLTLLWEQDFQLIRYTFVELASDQAPQLEKTDEDEPPPSPKDVRETVAKEEPEEEQGPSGVVRIDDFDSTLYFLDDKDVEYLKSEFEREYTQDLRSNILSILFDLFELQPFATVRAEIISIIENFIPYLLGVGDFRAVAYILHELKILADRSRELLPEHRRILEGLPQRLSDPDAVSQLLQSLDEAVLNPTEEELGALFGELTGEALEAVLSWLPRLSNERVRELLHVAVRRIASHHPDELAKALGSDDEQVVLGTVHLAGSLKLPPMVPALGGLLIQSVAAETKVAVVEALSSIGTPSAMQQLERAIDDGYRDVRIAVVRVLGAKGHRVAFPRIEAAVMGRGLKGADLTEKMAFFEAFGLLAGADAIERLKPMMASGGFMKKKQDPETRACAAMALGKIGTPEARTLLENANDKDPLVRNAIGKALREAK
jgi:hypothetical protein